MAACFYESKFVKRKIERQSLRIVLVQVASLHPCVDKLRDVPEEFVIEFILTHP